MLAQVIPIETGRGLRRRRRARRFDRALNTLHNAVAWTAVFTASRTVRVAARALDVVAAIRGGSRCVS